MTIVDANILIDFVKLQMLPNFFALQFEFCTTDLVLYELHPHQQEQLTPYLDNGTLQVIEITDEQLIEIIKITIQIPALSEQDCSAFYQAQQLSAILLTSDNKLRKYAQNNALEVHG